MKNKLDNGEYASIAGYRVCRSYTFKAVCEIDFIVRIIKALTSLFSLQRDLNLMCDNCMVYNQPETIFYKEAARLMGIGAKQLSKVKSLVQYKI